MFYGDKITKKEQNELKKVLYFNSKRLMQIKASKKCFGDQARDIVKDKIVDNLVYARILLEMTEVR